MLHILPILCTIQPTGLAAPCPVWAPRVGEALSANQSQTALGFSSLLEHCTSAPNRKEAHTEKQLLKTGQISQQAYFSQSAQRVSQRGISHVLFGQLRHQLLEPGFEQLGVWQQGLLTLRPMADLASLRRWLAKQNTRVSRRERVRRRARRAQCCRDMSEAAEQTFHSLRAV